VTGKTFGTDAFSSIAAAQASSITTGDKIHVISGLYTSGRNDDLRLARTAWSIPVVLDNAARALGY
jgi:hypothetical protein